MSTPQSICLVDCNNFFVSCERLFRPDLLNRPVLVLSSNDGCVISRSREVKALGIPMGIPYFEVRSMLEKHNVAVFSSNFTLYRDISSRVMETLATVVNDIEPYSIDEAFYTVDTSEAAYIAHRVRERIATWVGIPVSIGVAPTKTLAKLMGDQAKAGSGIALLDQMDSILDTSLYEVWGVGPSARTTLEKHGMRTVRDVVARRPDELRSVLGLHGERLHFELSGIPAVGGVHEPLSKSMMSTRSFGARVTTISALETAVAYHISRIAEKLRSHGAVAHGVTLYLRYEDADGGKRSMNRFVPFFEPLSDTRRMTVSVMEVVRAMYDTTARYKKAGIIAHGIVSKDSATGSLFERAAHTDALMKAVDRVNARHGLDTIRIGTIRNDSSWTSKKDKLSPSYTTSWSALPVASLSEKSSQLGKRN